ncbi:MAG: TonB-dependent receptor plug domain-containing protein [Gemmatimonadota bacterium]|nr:TonB-dependent receptor plug domain-containing protein [Gemmatimonadota bacterium]
MTRSLVCRSLRNGAGGLALAFMAGIVFPLGAQETGTITGQITDEGSGRPLASSQVYLEGTAFGTLTGNNGRYLFLNVPVGEYELGVQLLGYRTVTQTVTVTAGGSQTIDVGLTVTAIDMDEIVVTGTGAATEKKKLGNSIATVDVGRLEDVPITSFSDVLQGREAGVIGLPGGGDTGSSGRIRIRGSASLSQTNEPVIYLDGVRIDRGGGGGWGAAQAATRRIDDIDPNSIERIEILKGAAAATLYGTEASNGVIQIFTKRGRQGAARWSVQTDQTAIRAPFDRFIPHADFPRDAAEVARMQQRWGVSLQPFEVYEENYLKDFYNTGYAQTYSGSVEGGADLITYFLSARVHDENGPFSTLEGILPNNQKLKSEDTIGRRQATMNIGIFPFDNLRLRVTGLYSELNQTRMRGGNNIFGVFSLALMGQMRLADENNYYGSRAFATIAGDRRGRSHRGCRALRR